MTIEKGIRAFALQLPPSSSQDENSVDGNDDLGFLDTTKRSGKMDFFSFKNKEIPEEITLRVRLNPIPFEGNATTFQIKVNEKLYPQKEYYGLDALGAKQKGHLQYSQFQAVELCFQGQGSFLMKGERASLSSGSFLLDLKEGQCLLRKNFLFQKDSNLLQRKKYLGDSEWLITPPYGKAMINSYPLLAYGGYYKPGLPLSHVSQIFASIDLEDEKIPLLTLRSQRDLEEKRLPPPRSGYLFHTLYHYIDTFQADDLLNIEGHIQGGKSSVVLTSKDQTDLKNEPEMHRYRSYRYTQSDPASGLLDLHFKTDNASF